MSVEDTDFSPPATTVMFLLTIHPTTLEAGDFLSTDVKNAPIAVSYTHLAGTGMQNAIDATAPAV